MFGKISPERLAAWHADRERQATTVGVRNRSGDHLRRLNNGMALRTWRSIKERHR